MKSKTILLAAAALSLTACGPRIRPLQPVMDNGEVLRPQSEAVVDRARREGELERDRLAEARLAAAANALQSCAPEICAAIARGEVVLGMTEAQVLAATGTTPHAWETRGGGRATLMVARADRPAPRDAVGELALVSLRNGSVSNYTYREAQGFRTVSSPADATTAGRANALADAVLREGDAFAARGDLAGALDRYDRADVLRPNHAETTLRIAQVLDKQLRPLEAVLRYRLFIHQLELERIHAHGEAAAKMAEAIARAHERIIVLERRR